MHTINTKFNLTHLGLLGVSGNDAKKFLQGQLTCHLDEITASTSRLGAHCNPDGRVVSFFRLFCFRDDYYLQMPHELIPLAIKALQKYAVFFKVTLRDASQELLQIGYSGDALPDMPLEVNQQLTEKEWVCIRVPGTLARYQWIGHPAALTTEQSGSPEQWKASDIAEGLPAIYPETSGKFLPHDLNLPTLHAVSFNKGCYTGQEIIARMQYRGKLKNQLFHAQINTELTPIRGHDIYLDHKSAGSIVDFAKIDYNRYELLVVSQEAPVQTGQLCLDNEKKYFLEF